MKHFLTGALAATTLTFALSSCGSNATAGNNNNPTSI